jgi:capsular exopolysaccharide synthesis family protein
LTRDSQIFRARTIVDAAPGIKVAPNLLLTLAVAIMFGSMGGMGLAYAAEWTDRGFHDPEEIRRRLGVPVVGHVPYLPPCNGADIVVEGHLCAYHSPKSPQAEAFRGLRTSLYFSTHGRGHQVIQMTSPNKGDGKSTLLANLAISIAHSGKSVVLVDADFRRPSIHSLFRLDRSPVGLATILLGEVDLERALRAGPAPGLSLILCGPRPAQPAELLTSPRFHELLTQLRDRFDFVLIDTPPLLAVTDPAVVAPRVDGVLLAVRLSKKCRPSAERAKELLASLGAKIVGVVVNGMNGFGVGGHGYDYSYGYDCGDDDGESDAESPPQDGLPGFIENGAATPTRHRVG